MSAGTLRSGTDLMSRRPVPAPEQSSLTAGLRQALLKRKKAELVDLLLELAGSDRRNLWRLTARFDVAASAEELVARTRQAIAAATYFDKRDINRNFAYDYEAYFEVKRGLGRLIASGQLSVATQLALELMNQGSHQVEMSDEGLMTADIEDCLSVVLGGLSQCDLPAAEVLAWCTAMLAADRVKFIARESLESLRNRLQADRPE